MNQKNARSLGKLLMLISFLHIVSLIPGIPAPLLNITMFFIGMTLVKISISGLLAFLVFLAGFELWERNRVDLNEL